MLHDSSQKRLSQSELESLLQPSLNFSHFGVTSLSNPVSLEIYKNWLDEGLHGSMDYLQRHVPQKENPQLLMPEAKSAFVFAFSYVPHPEPQDYPFEAARVSLYARGADYHLWIRDRLRVGIQLLREQFPGAEFACFTDSAPVLERDLAYRAGLGWVGKNACVIHPQKGSLFFIGEIYSTLEVTEKVTPAHDFCGTCTRCMDACPTQALVEPRKLDATKCISYWTIETKEIPPLGIREKIGDWLFGCDICQTVCPWNHKAFKTEMELLDRREAASSEEQRQKLTEELRKILTSSNRELVNYLGKTALSRAAGKKLKRNAIVVATNLRMHSLLPEIENLKSNEELSSLIEWSQALLNPELLK